MDVPRILQMRVSPQAVELDVSTGQPDSCLTLRYDGSEMEEVEVELPRFRGQVRVSPVGEEWAVIAGAAGRSSALS